VLDLISIAIQRAAMVGVLACLISESEVASCVRDRLKWRVLYCPICLGFWLALPALWLGFRYYFFVVGLSNLWMLIILKTYESLEVGNATTEMHEER
jgi:hypothetical protein